MSHALSRAASCCAVLAVAALAACGKSEPPPPPPRPAVQKAPAPAVNEELKRLAAEVYIYAFPLILTDITRAADAASMPADTFRHERSLPDLASRHVMDPNADFLYSKAWLDLAQGPVAVSVPDSHGRYYLIAMLDAWTNVAASLGSRTTGSDKGRFVIVGPNWKGKLPGGVSEVRSPTDLAWLFARTQVKGPADRDAAARFQNEFKLARLAGSGKNGAKANSPAGRREGIAVGSSPRDQVPHLETSAFFTRFAELLVANAPAKDDAPMREKMQKQGIVAGRPFDVQKMDALSAASIEQGVKTARDAIVSAAARGTGGELKNGWTFDIALGRWGTDYSKRAVAAYIGIGLNAPEDAIFMATRVDATGHRLEGTNRYTLHFGKDEMPPADGFWSLSLYDDDGQFTANPINRYNIGSDSGLHMNADGSLDIAIQNANPGPDSESNWLPAPKGSFNLILRIYWPRQEVVDGKWIPPGIRPVA